ncbi:NYN domain-containing protein [Dysgonomonas sp. GY75]|uniref:NYN domain-containing protein n=1 Tax=Dysgonomonas sp. GY75 TaxID=2780419 RepID=UPI001883825A|nr:NYN domain-containing protein [Dysgonomonas sp. GY75]MBF0649256.1 NYN domain-containing protein [Dysgonomonas sp. GY75]
MKKDKICVENPAQRVAVLVDGDNASSAKLQDVTELAGRYGEVIVKKIYGDWTKTGLSSWKEPAKEFSYRLVEALPYVKGKNTTDMTLVIEAMDLLNSGNIDVFCIVSSDSDYTPLAMRIREEGLIVIGYGESKTPAAFVNSCKRFVFSDQIAQSGSNPGKGDTPGILLKKEADLFDKAYELAIDGKEEVTLSQIGMALKRIRPKFKTRRYGCKTLGAIYERLDGYEVMQTGIKGIYNVVRKKSSLQ